MICRIPGASALRCRASRCALGCNPTLITSSCTIGRCTSSAAREPAPLSCATTPPPTSHQLRLGATTRLSRSLTVPRAAVVFCSAASDDDSMEVEIKIEGMMCGGCTSRVEDVIKKMDGVRKVAVNLETKLALIEVKAASQMDALQVLPALVQAVKDLGFEAEPHFS